MDAYRDLERSGCPLCVPGRRCATCAFHKKFVARLVRQRHESLLEFETEELSKLDGGAAFDSDAERDKILEEEDAAPLGVGDLGNDTVRRKRAHRRKQAYKRLARLQEEDRVRAAPTLGVGGSAFQPGDARRNRPLVVQTEHAAQAAQSAEHAASLGAVGQDTQVALGRGSATSRSDVDSVAGRSVTSLLSFRSRLGRVQRNIDPARPDSAREIVNMKLDNAVLMKQRGHGFGELEPTNDDELLLASARSDLSRLPTMAELLEEVSRFRTWNLDNIIELVLQTEKAPMVAEELPPAHVLTVSQKWENVLIAARNKRDGINQSAKASWQTLRRTVRSLPTKATNLFSGCRKVDAAVAPDLGVGESKTDKFIEDPFTTMVTRGIARPTVAKSTARSTVATSQPTVRQARLSIASGKRLSTETIELMFTPRAHSASSASESPEGDAARNAAALGRKDVRRDLDKVPPSRRRSDRAVSKVRAGINRDTSRRRPASAAPASRSRRSIDTVTGDPPAKGTRRRRPQSAAASAPVPDSGSQGSVDESKSSANPLQDVVQPSSQRLPPSGRQKRRPQSAVPRRASAKPRLRPASAALQRETAAVPSRTAGRGQPRSALPR